MTNATVIIPFYNNGKQLRRCLEYLKGLDRSIFDLILVDDASEEEIVIDDSIRVIRHDKNLGPSQARNSGMAASQHNLCLFLDSDVLVTPKDVLLTYYRFSKDVRATAFTSGYDGWTDPNDLSFYSHYKNLYMSQVINNREPYVSFIYGSFCGLKKNAHYRWPSELRYGEDTMLATLLLNEGKEIAHYSDIKIRHLKRYSFLTLLKNDFLIPFYFSKSYLIKTRNDFSHICPDQLYAIACVPFIIITFPLWFYYNRHLFKIMPKNIRLKACFFTFIDQFVMGLGILTGLIYFYLHIRAKALVNVRV